MIPNLSPSAQLAQASYAEISANSVLATRLQSEAGGFTATQAGRFADKYSLAIDQFNDDAAGAGGNGTSFSVSVFKESSTKKLTVAIRGTLEQGDFIPTDANIAVSGAAYDQIIAMQNWWLRESSAAGNRAPGVRVKLFSADSHLI